MEVDGFFAGDPFSTISHVDRHFSQHQKELIEKKNKVVQLSQIILSPKDSGNLGKIRLKRAISNLDQSIERLSDDVKQIKIGKRAEDQNVVNRHLA